MNTVGRILTGIERDRVKLRAAAMRIIRRIIEQPLQKQTGDMRRDWLAPPPLSAFVRLEPIGFGFSEDGWWFNPDDCPPDLVWPLDTGVVIEHDDGRISLGRYYTITAKQARGYATRFSPFMVRSDMGDVWDGRLCCFASLWAWIGGKWLDADGRPHWHGAHAEVAIPDRHYVMVKEDQNKPALAISIALRQRYEWSVSLGLEHSPSIRFNTDPTGIKDIFRIRDLPEGRDRRAALMTWVDDHWRQTRHDPELEVYVRKHLRGATMFNWQNLQCELLPSQFDLDQRNRFIVEREALHQARLDKRPRIRTAT